MTKDWQEFFHEVAVVLLFLSLFPILTFLAYLVDLRFQPEPLQVVEGNGKKRRGDPRSLHVIERS